jgi:hypothetical protein
MSVIVLHERPIPSQRTSIPESIDRPRLHRLPNRRPDSFLCNEQAASLGRDS